MTSRKPIIFFQLHPAVSYSTAHRYHRQASVFESQIEPLDFFIGMSLLGLLGAVHATHKAQFGMEI